MFKAFFQAGGSHSSLLRASVRPMDELTTESAAIEGTFAKEAMVSTERVTASAAYAEVGGGMGRVQVVPG